jgi:hypothetical protein
MTRVSPDVPHGKLITCVPPYGNSVILNWMFVSPGTVPVCISRTEGCSFSSALYCACEKLIVKAGACANAEPATVSRKRTKTLMS